MAYLDGAADNFCRFITPSVRHSVFRESHYEIAGETPEVGHALTALSIMHTELLRKNRTLLGPVIGKLACEVVSFDLQTETSVRDTLFAQLHQILRNTYTEKGIVFGEFRKGSQGRVADGRMMEICPTNLLAIRSAYPSKDQRFFTKDRQLIPHLLESYDDGGPVQNDKVYLDIYEFVKANNTISLDDVYILCEGSINGEMQGDGNV